MSRPGKARDSVQRLHDMVVEEVSLVDRAANQHRFLIVKRSDEMDETSDCSAQEVAEAPTAEPDRNEDVRGTDTDPDPGQNPGQESQEELPLEMAAEVLSGLTEAVERLSAQDSGDEVKAQLAEMATELRDLSEQLAAATGAIPEGTSSRQQPPAAGNPDRPDEGSASPPSGLSGALEAMRAALGQLRDGLPVTSRGSAAPQKEHKSGKHWEPKSMATDAIRKQLSTLTDEVRSLTSSIQDQKQRLARLETSYGLPNSQPAGERNQSRPSDSDDDGWPLDLNTAFDRDSVEKSISFHDV
ncbi:MAG: hypothetical protein MJE77_17025 [Proteobacteria bacterium]|nr:hypothetical protein [Pseudomonadota bacterium]